MRPRQQYRRSGRSPSSPATGIGGFRLGLFLATGALLALISSCLGLAGGSTECGLYASDLRANHLADEGKLSESIAEAAPYPMAIILSQAAINSIFAAVAESELPPLTLSEDLLGIPVSVTLQPELPLIQVGGERGCDECLLTDLGFGLTVDVAGNQASGTGSGRYQFPLALRPNGLESTTVIARLAESSLVQVDLDIGGIDSRIMNALEPIIADAATIVIQQTVGDTELFDLGAWSFGDGDVRLLGRGPIIEPEYGTVVIGIHSNLTRPLNSTVEVAPALPVGADIGLQLHPELVQRMLQRMLHEGHIARRYDVSGQEDESGDHQVTLNFMQAASSAAASPDETDLMRTSFRLWRTSGGFCGYADLQADMGLSISDSRVSLAMSNLQVTDSAGAGQVLSFVSDWYQSAFTDQLIDFSELTINYREIELPGDKAAQMSAESFRLNLDARGLSVFLNIDAIVDRP